MDVPFTEYLAQRSPRLYYIGPAVACYAAIFLASGQSADTLPSVSVPFADKVAHLVAYGVTGFMTARAIGRGRPISWKQAALAVLICAAYGATDEIHQLYSDGRSAETGDWVADFIGACLGASLWKTGFFNRQSWLSLKQ